MTTLHSVFIWHTLPTYSVAIHFKQHCNFNWTTSNASSAGTTQIPNNKTTVLKPTTGFSEVEAVEPSTTSALQAFRTHHMSTHNNIDGRFQLTSTYRSPNNIGTSHFSSVQTAFTQKSSMTNTTVLQGDNKLFSPARGQSYNGTSR
jgi:hypothetical protein